MYRTFDFLLNYLECSSGSEFIKIVIILTTYKYHRFEVMLRIT